MTRTELLRVREPLTTRRDFLQMAGSFAGGCWGLATAAAGDQAGELWLATFRFDATPPKGHSLCGGWITPAKAVDDALEAIGIILIGAGQPIVICAVDWTGILNRSHLLWRQALADAAGTTPDRVVVHAVHQHNAPFSCLDAQRIVAQFPDLPPIVDAGFQEQCLQAGRRVVKASLGKAERVTHTAFSQAKVDRVASNRRILDENGKLKSWRPSSSKAAEHKALPEGLIDPYLQTVSFYQGDRRLAACHFYACHPMSYYGDGLVTADFVGLARKRRQAEEPDCCHLYFTGCAGNVAAGKYNDGSPEARRQLTDRIYDALRRSDAERGPPSELVNARWRTVNLLPKPNPAFDAASLERTIADAKNKIVDRNRSAFTLGWLHRLERRDPLICTALDLGGGSILFLPGETFVEYQLRARRLSPDKPMAVAAYGDGGPWYIPTGPAYDQGGYEVGVAFCDRSIDKNYDDVLAGLVS